MEHLASWIEGQLDALVADLHATLREADELFHVIEPARLAQGLRQAVWHFNLYAHGRDVAHLEALHQALLGVWGPDRLYLSVVARLLFGLLDLVSIRARSAYRDPDDFLDDLRALYAATRQALCHLADESQRRAAGVSAAVATRALGAAGTMDAFEPYAAGATASAQPAAQPVTRDQVAQAGAPAEGGGRVRLASLLGEQLAEARFVARRTELDLLWARLETLDEAQDGVHRVVGIKGAAGQGKSMLIDRFFDRFERRRRVPPLVLRTRAPRMFNVPRWSVMDWARQALEVPLGAPDGLARLRKSSARLATWQGPDVLAEDSLLQLAPYLAHLVGLDDGVERETPRRVGEGGRRALVALLEATARQAREETGGPLFLVVEDADELDRSSWALLQHALSHLPGTAPVMVLLSYDLRFSVPPGIARLPGFGEMVLPPFELADFEHLIEALLSPNNLGESVRLRLSIGAHGSPLLLHESVRQLVEDGVIGQGPDGYWIEQAPLPDGATGDLAAIVARRIERLSAEARRVLEQLVVVEDTLGGTALAELAARHGIQAGELLDALQVLERAGLIRAVRGRPMTEACSRHALVRDEVYRQMGQDRRRALHEEAGELFGRLEGTARVSSLAGGHLHLAGRKTGCVEALLRDADRCLAAQVLEGAMDLCTQALGIVDGMQGHDAVRFRFESLLRRERVHARTGQFEAQQADLDALATLARDLTSDDERRGWLLRTAGLAVALGQHAVADRRFAEAGELSPDSLGWARRLLIQAALAWQRQQPTEAAAAIETLSAAAAQGLPDPLKARVAHLHGRILAGTGRSEAAVAALHGAWRVHRERADLYGEGQVVRDLGELYWSRGRLLDAVRLLRRAEGLLRQAEAAPAQAEALLVLGQLLTHIGDFDEADAQFARVLRLVDKSQQRLTYAAAVTGQGWILVNRGRFEDAMSLLAQCLKDLGRRSVREPVYVETLLGLATNFTVFSRGEKLMVGGLRYAGDAADRAMDIGYLPGLVGALVVQVRGLVGLNRLGEAEARLAEVDAVLLDGERRQPELARLRTQVEYARALVCNALGDPAGAQGAMERARAELMAQVAGLEGSGFERGFMTNLYTHREILDAGT